MKFEAPSVVDYGDLAQITAGQASGNFLDQDFDNNTPVSELTFS